MIATKLCNYTKNHWHVYLKWVTSMVCKLHLRKAVYKTNEDPLSLWDKLPRPPHIHIVSWTQVQNVRNIYLLTFAEQETETVGRNEAGEQRGRWYNTWYSSCEGTCTLYPGLWEVCVFSHVCLCICVNVCVHTSMWMFVGICVYVSVCVHVYFQHWRRVVRRHDQIGIDTITPAAQDKAETAK